MVDASFDWCVDHTDPSYYEAVSTVYESWDERDDVPQALIYAVRVLVEAHDEFVGTHAIVLAQVVLQEYAGPFMKES